VLIRPDTHIPVRLFDGEHIPLSEKADHTSDARILLREAARVSRRHVVIKDHLREGLFAKATLQAMDWVGNYGHEVALPYNYVLKREWHEHSRDTNLSLEHWRKDWNCFRSRWSLAAGFTLSHV